MQKLLSLECYKYFSILNFVANRISHIQKPADFRGRENTRHFEIDVHDRHHFQLYLLKQLLYILYIDNGY